MSENYIELLRIISELKTSESRPNQALGAEISRHIAAIVAESTTLRDALKEAEIAIFTAWEIHPNISALYRYIATHPPIEIEDK